MIAGGKRGDRAVRRGGGELADAFRSAITRGKHACAGGLAVLGGDDITLFVQLHEPGKTLVCGALPHADEKRVQR